MKYFSSISFILFFLYSFNLFPPQSDPGYFIENIDKVTDIERYAKALNSVDLDRYRLQNERVQLKFKCGIKVILYSYDEIKNGVRSDKKINYRTHNAIFLLDDSGLLFERHKHISK